MNIPSSLDLELENLNLKTVYLTPILHPVLHLNKDCDIIRNVDQCCFVNIGAIVFVDHPTGISCKYKYL